MTIYLGLIGLPGAGKSTVSNIILDQIDSSEMVTMGDIVRDLAADENRTNSEEIREFATNMREEHGKGVFAKKLIEQYTFSKDLVVIDGIRSPEEISLLKEHTNNRCVIAYVHTPYQIRYNRVVTRGRDGEEDMTEEDFKERENEELSWGMREILDEEQYDYTIANDGSYAELESEVSTTIEQVVQTHTKNAQ